MLQPCYVFDIDGTLANIEHRLYLIKKPKPNWDAFFDACVDDEPIRHACRLAQYLSWHRQIIFCTGRSERVRNQTCAWLIEHVLDFSHTKKSINMFMRPDGDYQKDALLKKDMLGKIRMAGFWPNIVFDDRQQCVDMWREHGVPCFQVAKGDF